jgi:O-antigen ligase
MRFLVPLVAALVPLLITPGWLSHFDVTPKIAIFQLGAALIFLYQSANVQKIYNLLRQPAGRWLAGAVAATWMGAALATAFSTHAQLSLNGSAWRRLGLIPETGLLLFVLLTAAWLAAEPRNIRTLLRAATASGALAAAYGIAQYFGWDPLLPAKAYEVGEGQFMIVRPPGTLGHADYFAAWLVVIVFLGIALERLETQAWLKRAAVGTSALAAVAIVLSGTRSAMLGLVAGGVVFLILGRARIRARPIVLGFASAAALALFFFSPAGLKLRARVHWSLEDARGGARLLLWRDSLRMAAERPVAGFGPETFSSEFPRFESVDLARAFPDFYHESPHNMFLDALASEGVAGLLILLCVCGLGAWWCWRCARSGRPLAAPLAAALGGIVVTQQFIVFIAPTSLYFYLVLALLAASADRQGDRAPSASRFSPWILVPALGVLLVLGGYSVRLLAADAAWADVQSKIAAGDASGASNAYRSVLRWQLPGTADDLAYSREMQGLAASSRILVASIEARQQALEAGLRAVGTAEDLHNAWYNLAMLRAGNNDAPGVEEALRHAIACAPNWFKPHWALAQVLALAGHRQEALLEAREAVQLDGGHDPEVTETWNTLEKQAHREQ